MWSQVLLMVFLFALLTGALSPFVCMIALVLPVVAVCHQRSSRFCPRLAWCILVLLFDCRVGEASNPGPPLEDNFVMGAFNPSGLRGKAPFLVSHLSHGDLWAVSETHLSQQGIKDFHAGLRFAQSSFKCIAGHPVPTQKSKTHQGQWKGVAMLSKFPTRALPMYGPQGVFDSARAMITATLAHDVWITGGVVYGEPDGHLYPHHDHNNQLLLHHVASQVCGLSKGPRFVAGDWNCEIGSLPVFELLMSYGFRDIQDVAWSRWGIPCQPTCKHKTRKDFLFLSPEMQALLVKCEILQDVWPDHAVVQGTFQCLSQSIPRQIWPMPSPLPWPLHWTVDSATWQSSNGSVDDRYAAVWQHIETTAIMNLPFRVSNTQRGRAATRDTKPVVSGKIAPVKKGRNGDFAPQFLCSSFRHAQWVRQVRRLQSYVHFAKSGRQPIGGEHSCAVWGSIVRAKGFPPDFCTWWQQSKHRVHGAPSTIPLLPPDVTQASCICDSVTLAVREFETQLKKSSRAYARLRRESNPNLVFQDIKSHADKGVELLLHPLEAIVTEVRPQEAALVLDRSPQFCPEATVVCKGQPVPVIHAEEDCLWVENAEDIQPGDKVVQLSMLGTDQQLFQVFLEAWKSKWGRHADVPASRWQVIIQFAREKLPTIPMCWESLDKQLLYDGIRQKKAASSHGLDGVTLRDLKALPVEALNNFCDMFMHAESTGEWPSQVIAGRVTSLAKIDQPRTPMDFRPITVFSILYRCWGSFHSKHILQCLEPHLPVGLFGSRPKCFAGQIWSQVLWTIEHAHLHDIHLCGLIADLQKAFNMLPRLVVMEACASIGVPLHILVAWSGALSGMTRRFQIRNALSPAAMSTCGFPEGDALSCVAMMVIDMIYHEWFKHFLPPAQPLSYVDDWQVLICNPHHMSQVSTQLDALVNELDLLLDKRKSHVWAVQPNSRALLRAQGFALVGACKSLGAHVQVTKQHTNKSQMERVESLQGLWQRLRLSTCGYQLKVRAIKSAAWPRGLHAIAATTVSVSTYQSLRAGAMRGLKEDHAGSNAMLHLGLAEDPLADPQFWSILQTLRFVRDCGRKDIVQPTLVALVQGETTVRNTISATLLTRLQTLGWHVNEQGRIVDGFGSFSLFSLSCVELKLRMEWQWLQVVSSATSHRILIGGMDQVWPQSTRQWLSMQNPSDQALYRKVLNGTHITQDGKRYCKETDDDQCPFCLCSDSRYHRFWQCDRFEWARSQIPTHVLKQILDLPEAVTCFGWDLRPSTMQEWWSYFAQLQRPPPEPARAQQGPVHLFTDGSCVLQSHTHLRFAAWAVVLAAPGIHDLSETQILDSGVLPGLLQSAVRAEIFAILRALEFAAAARVQVVIWSDCKSAVVKMRRMIAGAQVQPNSAHADLWIEIAHHLHDLQHMVQINRVQAHKEVGSATNPHDAWCFCHNGIADRAAVSANMRRSPYFWDLQKRHFQAVEFVDGINCAVRNVILQISQDVVRQQDHQEEPEANAVNLWSLPLPAWGGLMPLAFPRGAIRWYGECNVRLLLSWFWDVLFTSSSTMKWVSHWQLYADFMGSTGNPGPVKDGVWKNGAGVPLLSLRGFSFKLRAKWFTKLLKECLRHMGQKVEYAVGLPQSHMIKTHTGLFAVPWPDERLSAIDDWMFSCVPHAFFRQTKAVDSLPYVSSIKGLVPAYVSTAG